MQPSGLPVYSPSPDESNPSGHHDWPDKRPNPLMWSHTPTKSACAMRRSDHLTFDAAIQNESFSLVSKQRLAIVRRDLFKQLDSLALA